MFLGLTELQHHKIDFDVVYRPGEIQLSPDLSQETDLHVVGSAELLRNTLGEIRVRGDLETSVMTPCDRCLEPSHLPIHQDFDLFYRPLPKGEGHHEHRIAEGEVDLSFYTGNGLQLEDVVREFILLQVPMQVFCRETCRGICPVCVEDRNSVSCECVSPPADDRWLALKEYQAREQAK